MSRTLSLLFFGFSVMLAPLAQAQAPSGEVTLELDSDERLAVWLETAEGGARRLCRAPCSFDIAPGTHRFALSRRGEQRHLTAPLEIEGPGSLFGRYVDNSGLRAGGWTLFAVALAAAAGLAIGGAVVVSDGTITSLNGGASLIAAGGLHFLFALAGLPMMAAGDGAILRFD